MTSTTSDDRQAAIIRAVWKVIAEQGMGAVSMRTVATTAAVSVGRIQYRFRTKDELLRASLEAMLSHAEQLHADAVEGVGDDRDTLWHLVAQPILQVRESRAGVSVFHQYVAASINHPTLARLLAQAKDGQEREAARLLHQIAPSLPDPRAEARSLVATADGLVVRVLTGGLSARQAKQVLRTAMDHVTGFDSEVQTSPATRQRPRPA